MFLASRSLTRARNIVKLAEKNDVKEYATQHVFYCRSERGDDFESRAPFEQHFMLVQTR